MALSNPTAVRKLAEVLHSVKPEVKALPGYEGKNVSRYSMEVCMDECFPGLYIGDL